MLRVLSSDEIAFIAGGEMLYDDYDFSGGDGGGAAYGASGSGSGLPFTLNPDGSIPTYVDPNTGDIVVTAPYTNSDMQQATIAVDGAIAAAAVIGVTGETKLLQALGASGGALAGLHYDQIKVQVATAQRDSENIYGYNLYNRLNGGNTVQN